MLLISSHASLISFGVLHKFLSLVILFICEMIFAYNSFWYFSRAFSFSYSVNWGGFGVGIGVGIGVGAGVFSGGFSG